jgi:hypothetical protein
MKMEANNHEGLVYFFFQTNYIVPIALIFWISFLLYIHMGREMEAGGQREIEAEHQIQDNTGGEVDAQCQQINDDSSGDDNGTDATATTSASARTQKIATIRAKAKLNSGNPKNDSDGDKSETDVTAIRPSSSKKSTAIHATDAPTPKRRQLKPETSGVIITPAAVPVVSWNMTKKELLAEILARDPYASGLSGKSKQYLLARLAIGQQLQSSKQYKADDGAGTKKEDEDEDSNSADEDSNSAEEYDEDSTSAEEDEDEDSTISSSEEYDL